MANLNELEELPPQRKERKETWARVLGEDTVRELIEQAHKDADGERDRRKNAFKHGQELKAKG